MAELKFNKVLGINYWLSDDISNEHGKYKYRICTNRADYYQLDLITGFQTIDHGQFDTVDAAMIHAASLEQDSQAPDYGFILQCLGIVSVIVLGIICIYKFWS